MHYISDEDLCDYCKENILPEKSLKDSSLCEGSYCEEARDAYEQEDHKLL